MTTPTTTTPITTTDQQQQQQQQLSPLPNQKAKVSRDQQKPRRAHIYTGQQKKAVRHGYGVYTYTNRFFQYEGEWVNGKKHGLGQFLMNDGSYYNGEFENGEIEGNGIRYFGISGNKYTGTFHRGELHGQGIMEYKNGSVYEGDWNQNKRQGHGTLKEKGGAFYDGPFYQHKRHGRGTQTYQNGDTYVGDWIEDKRQGHGALKSLDNTCYEGQWANDVMSGWGRIDHSSGIVYEGFWINGIPEIMATKLVFVPNVEMIFIEKEKEFKIEVQCYNNEKELITEDGRKVQLISGIPYVPPPNAPNVSPSESSSEKNVEESLIETPFGFKILPSPLTKMPLEEESSNKECEEINPEEECEPEEEIQPVPLTEEMTIKVSVGGKCFWEELLPPIMIQDKSTALIKSQMEISNEKSPQLNTGTNKNKKENPIIETEEKSVEFVLIANDITNPPFMNQRLQSAFLRIKFSQPKIKIPKWTSAQILSRLKRIRSSMSDQKQSEQ